MITARMSEEEAAAARQRQDARLLKILVDGPDDLDWAKIFGEIDPSDGELVNV